MDPKKIIAELERRGISKKDILDMASEDKTKGSALDPLHQALTWGFADELGGYGSKLGYELAKMTGNLAPERENKGGDVARKETARQRGNLAAFRERNPVTSFGIEAAGALATGAPGAKLATTVPRMMGLGTLEGAIYGAGSADENKAAGAALGGLFGFGSSAVAPLVATGVGKGGGWIKRNAIDPIREKMSKESTTSAGRIIDEMLAPANVTPQVLRRRAAQMGPDATLVDLDPGGMTGLAQGVIAADKSGQAMAQARRVYPARAKGSTTRVKGAVSRATGDQKPMLDVLDSIKARQRANANTDYSRVYNYPDFDAYDDKLLELANRPGVRGALRKAVENAKNKSGRDLPSIQKIIMAGDDVEITKDLAPDMEAWDQIKRTLDKQVKSAYRDSDAGADSLRSLRDQIRTRLDELNPEYRSARNRFAGDAALEEAMEEGENFLTRKTRQVREFTRKLTDSEREAYLTGATEAIKEKMGKAKSGQLSEFNFMENGNAREKLRMLFPKGRDGDKAVARLMRELNTERRFAETQGKLIGNSETQMRAAAENMINKKSGLPTSTEILTSPGRGAANLAMSKASAALSGLSNRTISELTGLLMTPGNVDAVIAELNRRGTPKPIIDNMLKRFTQAGVTAAPAAGLLGGEASNVFLEGYANGGKVKRGEMRRQPGTDIDEILEYYDKGNARDTFNALRAARANPDDVRRYSQQDLANAEHYQVMDRMVSEYPYLAIPNAISVPGYYAAKKLGLMRGRSEPTLEQVMAGWRGIAKGLFGD